MSRLNYVQDPQQPEIFQGMDSTSPIQALQEGYVVSAKNCLPGLFGGVVKRSGYTTQLTSTYGSRSITGGIEFRAGGGSRRVVVFGTDGTAAGGRFGYINAGAVTDISTGLSGTTRPGFVQHGDLLFFYNGVDSPKCYDGSSVRQVGITAPASAPTIALGAGGSLNTSANYIWAYTYYNSVTGAESSPSTLSTTTGTGANTKATLTILAGDSTTADTIRVWRTVANGNTLFLDGTAAITATSYVSSVADSALTTQLEIDNTRITTLSSTAQYPLVAQQRVFLKVGRNQIRYSKVGQSGPMPESFQVAALASTAGTFGSNDDIVGLGAAGDVPIVIKERSVGRLEPIGFNAPSVTDPIIWNYVETAKDVGGVSHWASTQVLGECIFLGKDNVYGTRGQAGDLRPIANTMQSTIKALGFSSTQVSKISAVNDQKLRCVYFAVFATSSDANPTYVLVGDYRLYPNFRWSLWTPGTNTNTHPGVQAASFIPVTNTDGTQDIYFGNTNLNGQVYRMNDGDSDNGSGIYFEIVTRPYACGSAAAVKLYKDAFVYVAGSGADYSLSVSSIYDMSGGEELSGTLSLSSGGSVWDNATWDSSLWSALSVPPRKYQVHRKAQHQQLVFRQTGASAPLTLYSWFTTGSSFRVF